MCGIGRSDNIIIVRQSSCTKRPPHRTTHTLNEQKKELMSELVGNKDFIHTQMHSCPFSMTYLHVQSVQKVKYAAKSIFQVLCQYFTQHIEKFYPQIYKGISSYLAWTQKHLYFRHIVLILLKYETHKLLLLLHAISNCRLLSFILQFVLHNQIVNHSFCNMDAIVYAQKKSKKDKTRLCSSYLRIYLAMWIKLHRLLELMK